MNKHKIKVKDYINNKKSEVDMNSIIYILHLIPNASYLDHLTMSEARDLYGNDVILDEQMLDNGSIVLIV